MALTYIKSNKNILVDDVKNLIEDAVLTPVESDKKIYIFKNFSSANTQSQNKLLKILEEPPKNVYIFLFKLFCFFRALTQQRNRLCYAPKDKIYAICKK